MSSARIASITTWIARAAWVGVLAFGIGAFAPVLDNASASTSARLIAGTVAVILATLWIGGAVALAFRSTATLTIARVVVPASTLFAVGRWVEIGATPDSVATLITAGVASAAVLNADLGNSYVQASAYGAERRALLRPPAVYLGLTVAHWLVTTVSLVVAIAALTSQRWWVGLATSAIGAGLAAVGWPRWHKLARRWLVLVPIGLVIHDHVVLAETAMIGRRKINSLHLHRRHVDDALDLTGGVRGPTVEIEFNDLETLTTAATPAEPTGRAFHARTVAVAPSRPGRFLVEADHARLPVGRSAQPSTLGERSN